MDSAQSLAVAGAPEQVVSFNDYTGYSSQPWIARGINDFIGNRYSKGNLTKEYEAYLNNVNARNEYNATISARQWDKFLSDTQYQRMVADLKAAGLNPWLAVQSGISGSSVPSSAKADYSAKNNKEPTPQKTTYTKDLAMLLLVAARLIARH